MEIKNNEITIKLSKDYSLNDLEYLSLFNDIIFKKGRAYIVLPQNCSTN